jgi:hypothetical protein
MSKPTPYSTNLKASSDLRWKATLSATQNDVKKFLTCGYRGNLRQRVSYYLDLNECARDIAPPSKLSSS